MHVLAFAWQVHVHVLGSAKGGRVGTHMSTLVRIMQSTEPPHPPPSAASSCLCVSSDLPTSPPPKTFYSPQP